MSRNFFWSVQKQKELIDHFLHQFDFQKMQAQHTLAGSFLAGLLIAAKTVTNIRKRLFNRELMEIFTTKVANRHFK